MIGQNVASKSTPAVNVVFPNGGESLNGNSTTFRWEASDADGDSLTYVIQFSKDGGSTWRTLDLDWPEKTYEVTLDQLGETLTGRIRIMASDGFNVSTDDSDGTFITPNNAPSAFITTPSEGATYVGVEPIFFRATARDVEDGSLTGTALSWSSNLDGFLGNGESFFKRASELKEGEHTITLTARDKAGATVSRSVKITILRFPPNPW